MKILLGIVLLLVPLLAQEPSAPSAKETDTAEKPDLPTVSPEQWLAGSVEFGYRWLSPVSGDFDTYRSVVNLGEGPKLFGFDCTLQDPSRRLFDRVDLRAHSWGGEPYNIMQIDARRERAYQFSFDYRNIAYFNFLPSFANPGRERGLSLNQRSFDTLRRTIDMQLAITPGRRLSPYLAYTRNSGFGTGSSVFFTEGNEFPVATQLRDHTDNYRGGMQVEFNRFHVTVEQGWTISRDDQQLFNSDRNAGNVSTPFLGQRLFLTDLVQAYGVRGDGTYSKGLIAAAPASWANIYGQFLYSRPHTSVNYFQNSRGNFFLFDSLAFYSEANALVSSEARLPHTSASLSVELRPARRFRITELWSTDRLHSAGAMILAERFLLSGSVPRFEEVVSADRLIWNYNQHELDLFFNVNSKLTLRGGHRYVWGNARVRSGQVSWWDGTEPGELARHVALAGVNWRPNSQFRVNLEFEGSAGDRTYFRTSLQNYQMARLMARYQIVPSFVLSANVSVLRNQNPTQNVEYDFLSRQNTISAMWTPRGGKRLGITAEYSRCTLRSNLGYFAPSTLTSEASFYRDNAHIGTAVVSLTMPVGGKPKLSFGGSFFISSGSRPARYYQPLTRISLPLGQHAEWNSEWQWYALSQSFYSFEGFRTHQLVTALRVAF